MHAELFLDEHSRDQAIVWYKKAFELHPNEYSGINLATLMVIRGESFTHSAELNQIGELHVCLFDIDLLNSYAMLLTALLLNSLLGRKGSIEGMNDYWDVATFFEMSVLVEDYPKACQAAKKMFILDPPAWLVMQQLHCTRY